MSQRTRDVAEYVLWAALAAGIIAASAVLDVAVFRLKVRITIEEVQRASEVAR